MIWKNLSLIFIIFIITTCGSKVQQTSPRSSGSDITYGNPYVVKGVKYYRIQSVSKFKQRGIASWYGKYWHGRLTANGEKYDMNARTAAHKTLPLGSMVHVRNLDNGKTATVRINDRGPFVRGRIIDMSYWGAKKLGIVDSGTATVQLTLLSKHNDLSNIEPQRSSSPKGHFQIQIASFESLENAKKVKKKYSRAIIKSEEGLHRVRIIGFNSKKDAESYKHKIRNQYPGAFILSE